MSVRLRELVGTAAVVTATLGFGLLAAFPARAEVARARVTPSLSFATVATHRLAVASAGWRAGEHVLFSASEGSLIAGVDVVANRKGKFVLGMDDISMCASPVFTARNFRKQKVTLKGPGMGCPLPANPPTPRLFVLTGKQARAQTATIYGIQPRAVTLHVGDDLHIWESGTSRPAFRPHLDSSSLFVIREGTTPPRMCPQVDCDAGFFWDVVAVKAGKTMIDMAPGCRESRPQCGLADMSISIKILPGSPALQGHVTEEPVLEEQSVVS